MGINRCTCISGAEEVGHARQGCRQPSWAWIEDLPADGERQRPLRLHAKLAPQALLAISPISQQPTSGIRRGNALRYHACQTPARVLTTVRAKKATVPPSALFAIAPARFTGAPGLGEAVDSRAVCRRAGGLFVVSKKRRDVAKTILLPGW